VSPFRLFGQAPEAAPAPPDADGTVGWAAGPWSADPTPATRHARPLALRRDRPGDDGDDDPPTDPFGFPPLPITPEWSAPASPQPAAIAAPPPDPSEAAALAGAFAADYLSWDEDDPARRGRALAEYLPAAAADPAELGWAGQGRQRAEFVLTGRVRPDGEGRVLVDVRVRVTPYRPVGDGPAARPGPPAEEARSEIVGTPAAAPAPTAPGWRSLASQWVRLTVPVVLDGDRLLVDAWEELIGGRPKSPTTRRPDDHQLDEDEPVAEPVGGASR
jgi:hypothetical protein